MLFFFIPSTGLIGFKLPPFSDTLTSLIIRIFEIHNLMNDDAANTTGP